MATEERPFSRGAHHFHSERSCGPELRSQHPGITDSGSLRDWVPLSIGLDGSTARRREVMEAISRDSQGLYPNGTRPAVVGHAFRGTRVVAAEFSAVRRVRRAAADRLGSGGDGLSLSPLRARAIEAARGTTNFDEYFLYFGFFLIISALLLIGLFFRLGVEQRPREIGILRSLGFSLAKIRNEVGIAFRPRPK